MRTVRSVVYFCGFCFLLLGSRPAAAQTVFNGGFEIGSLFGWATTPADEGSNFGVINQGRTGTYSVYFNATGPQPDSIAQTINTTAGVTYVVELWVLNYGAGEDLLRVDWEGSNVILEEPVGTELEQWVKLSFQRTATASGSNLKISAFDNAGALLIDDIRITVVPEAGTLVLAGMGLAGAVVLRRFRKR